jgi:hypothetical protein
MPSRFTSHQILKGTESSVDADASGNGRTTEVRRHGVVCLLAYHAQLNRATLVEWDQGQRTPERSEQCPAVGEGHCLGAVSSEFDLEPLAGATLAIRAGPMSPHQVARDRVEPRAARLPMPSAEPIERQQRLREGLGGEIEGRFRICEIPKETRVEAAGMPVVELCERVWVAPGPAQQCRVSEIGKVFACCHRNRVTVSPDLFHG